MFDFLSYSFMQYALILGLAIGLATALISPFLVLSNQAMIADGLSHVSFTGIIFGLLLFDQPIYFAIIYSVIGALIISFLSQQKMIKQDSAIGVVSAFSLAIGLIVVSLSDGFNRSIESLLVGSILTVGLTEVIVSLIILLLVTLFVVFNYRRLLSITYDNNYAKFSGIKYHLLKYMLAAITAVIVVVGVRTVGMLLISAFIIFPALIASQISKSFKHTLIISLISAFITVFISIFISFHLNIPTGSTIVVLYSLILIVSIFYRRIKKINV